MAVQHKVGDFQLRTTTGNQSITGLGFQPKLVLFFHTPDTVNIVNQTANFNLSWGATDGTNMGASIFFSPNGNSGLESAFGAQCTTNCIVGSIDTATMWRATIVSMDGDGFTLNVPLAPTLGYRVGYLAIGGATLTGAKVGTFNASSGTQSITGLGFQPTGIIMFSAGRALTANPSSLTAGHVYGCFGMSDGASSRSAGFTFRSANLTVKLRGRICRSNMIMAAPNITTSPSTGYQYQFNLTSFDADGFTVTHTTGGSSLPICYMAFAGAATKVGNFTTPSILGPFSITSLAFNPASVLTASTWQSNFGVFGGMGAVSNGSGALVSTGMAVDVTEQLTVGGTTIDFTTTTVEAHHSDDTKIMRRFSPNPFTTLEMDFAHANMSTGAVNFNCTTPSGTLSVVNYMAIEGAAFTPPPSEPTGGSGDPASPDSSFLYNMI